MLEQLFIEECGMKNIRCFNISAHALKCLAMECAILDNEYATEFCGYRIVIDAPKLEYLRLYDYVAEGYHFKNLKSLIEAQVHVDLSPQRIEQRDRAYNGQKVLELIKGIHNVKVLHLTGDSMEVSFPNTYILSFQNLIFASLMLFNYLRVKSSVYYTHSNSDLKSRVIVNCNLCLLCIHLVRAGLRLRLLRQSPKTPY